MGNTSGARVYFNNTQESISVPSGKLATVFQTEVHAIICRIFEILKQEPDRIRDEVVTICSDSQAALKAPSKNKRISRLLLKRQMRLISLSALCQLSMIWICQLKKEQTIL